MLNSQNFGERSKYGKCQFLSVLFRDTFLKTYHENLLPKMNARNGDRFMPGGRVGKRRVSVAERSSRDQDELLPKGPTVFGERGDTVK